MKRYLLAGASRGIGRAIAETLAGSDVELLLHGRDTVTLAEVCDSVKGRCARVVRLIHDLAVPSGVSDLIDQVGNKPLDLLVNNAGIAIVKLFCEITAIEWQQAFCPWHAARFQHRQHSFHRSENRFCELERLLHEQVCVRRVHAIRA